MLRLPVAAAFLVVLTGCASHAPAVPVAPAHLDDAAAATALNALASAIGARDADAAAALAADKDAGALLTAAASNAAALDVDLRSLRFVDDDPAVTAELPKGRHAAVAQMEWALEGLDRGISSAEVTVLLAQDDDGVDIAGFGGGQRPVPLWMTGALTVHREPGLVVAGRVGAPVDRVTRLAATAVREVTDVLGEQPPLVVEIPASAADVDRVLGASEGDHATIAAVTTPIGRDHGPRTPVHVVVNPTVLGGLGDAGAQIVMTHEVAHFATDAVHAQSPLWLLEGFADHVALRDTTLPLTRTAAQIAAQVKAGGTPEALPSAAEFGSTAPHLGALYESAWRAVEVLVAARGEGTLRELYRRTAAGEPVDPALRALYGFGEGELTRRWRADLTALPGAR